MSSTIEWTDETWNPTVGCSEVSAGCDHCYAARVAARGMTSSHRGLTELINGNLKWTGEVRTLEDRLDQPAKWNAALEVEAEWGGDPVPTVPLAAELEAIVTRIRGDQ